MIQLSHSAASEILRLKARRKVPDLLFRLRIQSAGCLGLLYQMEFEQTTQPNDSVFECNGVQVVIDPKSLTYVNGTSLDYSEDLMGGGFRFHNPNAVQNCGCGNSFSVT